MEDAQKQLEDALKREERLRAAIDYILCLNAEKNPHLGRPRTSDMSCIFCMGYLALNYDAYGEKIETQEYKDLAQKLRDKWSKKS